MKSFILAYTLILGATQALAEIPIESLPGSPSGSQRVKVISGDDVLGQNGVTYFNELLKKSELYAYLVSIEREVPDIAKSLEYLASFREAHLANQTLSHLLIALNQNNRLLEKIIEKGGGMNG